MAWQAVFQMELNVETGHIDESPPLHCSPDLMEDNELLQGDRAYILYERHKKPLKRILLVDHCTRVSVCL